MFIQPTLLSDEAFELSIKPMNDFPLHWHSDLEILCCIEGSYSMRVGETKYTICKDDVILIGSCEPHLVCECAPGSSSIIIRLGSLFCGSDSFRKIIQSRFRAAILKKNPAAMREVERIVSILSLEMDHKSNIALRGCLYYLLANLLDNLPPAIQMSDNYQKRLALTMVIQKAIDFVSIHYSENISLSDVASVSGYVKSAFCRMFKNVTGCTFHKYLNDYRINKSLALLSNNHYSISEISTMVGFSQQKNFSRIFKDTIGITPTEYRRQSLTQA